MEVRAGEYYLQLERFIGEFDFVEFVHQIRNLLKQSIAD